MMSALKSIVPLPIKRIIRRYWRRPVTERWVTADHVHAEIEHARKTSSNSQTEWMKALQSFWVRLPAPPADPWSEDYKQHWHTVYKSLAGSGYDISREGHDFDAQAAISRPFPYVTESYEIVGTHLMGIGSLIRAMRLPPRASILEFGPGCGNTTLALAQMGYDVTAIDIESRYIDVIQARAEMLSIPVKTICGDFFKIRDVSEQFDAILFCACFHHCIDHLSLLDQIPARLRPGGKLIFAAETIVESIPYPWGINPNGEALFQIVTKGWMELAFRESYFVETLERRGWKLEKHDSAETASAIVYVCTRD